MIFEWQSFLNYSLSSLKSIWIDLIRLVFFIKNKIKWDQNVNFDNFSKKNKVVEIWSLYIIEKTHHGLERKDPNLQPK
jgi:hypothetical protein